MTIQSHTQKLPQPQKTNLSLNNMTYIQILTITQNMSAHEKIKHIYQQNPYSITISQKHLTKITLSQNTSLIIKKLHLK